MGGQRKAYLTHLHFRAFCVLNTGIDKLTEKSQVSEDGTMRSLEPESSQPLPEGNLPSAASDGEPWSGVRAGTAYSGTLGEHLCVLVLPAEFACVSVCV